MVGFGDGESEVELIISDNGWVAKATVYIFRSIPTQSEAA
jgi:hypothetical protein